MIAHDIVIVGGGPAGMAAAVAACAAENEVIIYQSECAGKSYPRFWEDFDALKGENK